MDSHQLRRSVILSGTSYYFQEDLDTLVLDDVDGLDKKGKKNIYDASGATGEVLAMRGAK